ncbi:hypothetical protein M758_1G020200 [Ceratodon purpureus]|nr:hypothetical protein M758_1G020200 [Ceratodon purpureus]
MGTPGPPGAYDPHKYFRGSPQGSYPSQTSGYQPSSPGNSFHHQPSHTYPPGSIPPGSFSPNASMYPGSPGLNYAYNTTQFQPAGSPVYHGPQYGHYNQDHSPRQDPHLASQFSQQSTQLPSSPSHTNQSRIPISSISAPPPPIFPQSRSSQPMPSLPTGADRFSQPLDGARLMALLTTHSEGEGAEVYEETVCLPGAPQSSPRPPLFPFRQVDEMPGTPPPMSPALPTPNVSLAHSVQGRQAPKIPRGRHIRGDYVTYDVDARKAGDGQAELAVSPITLYSSETTLALGRQIAVNKKFVCYGLRGGQIRILNINNSQRVLLRGHTQRVTDMTFFSEDVPILASASQDGRIYIRKIVESHGEGGKLTEQILLALQFLGNWEKCHPRLCWHSQKQDLLVVAIGKFVILIDIYHVATPGGFNVDVPVECRMENPVRGVYVIGQHDDDVTELASCASGATSLATASKDGTVRLWENRKQSPAFVVVPFGGNFVDAVAFLPSPRGTDGHVLLTGGPLNRELKLWALDDQSIQSGHAVWRCIQTLEFQSNSKPDVAFFNQVVVSSRANLILLANAKRNAIYVAHIDFSSPSGGPRIDYLTEFSVTMPILSLTVADDGISESGEGILKIFCLQTHGIYQYTVDMAQCLPNLIDGDGSTPNTPKKGLGMMPVSAPPISSSFPASDKTHPRPMPNQPMSTGMNSNASSLNSNPGIPPRPTALGNLIELGYSGQVSASESNKAFEGSKLTLLRDSKDVGAGKPSSPGSHSMLDSGGQSGNRGITRPDSTREVLPPSNLSKPPTPPPRRRSLRSRSPAKAPSLPRYKAERMEETKEILLDNEASADTTQSSFNSNSIEYESGDQEDKDGISSSGTGNPITTQQQMGPQLISPSDIMSIVAGSKQDHALPQETGLDLMDVSDWQDEAKVRNVTACKDRVTWPSEEPVPDREDISDFSIPPLFDSSEGQSGTATECFEKEITTESDWQGRGTGDEAQDGDLIEDKERPTPDDLQDQLKTMALKLDRQAGNVAAGVLSPISSAAKGRKSKNKNGSAASVPLPTSLQLRLNPATGSSGEAGSNSTQSPMSLIAQVESMQESIFQLIEMQKELQKQIITTVANPVVKEGKRLEGVLGQRLEKLMKANADSMWVRLAEENAKREKQDRERILQITSLLSDFSAKDFPAALELGLKKEVAAIGVDIAQTLVVPVQNAVSAALTECFQKSLNEKVIPQMEKTVLSKLEATMTKQLKFQFQTSGKQALQDGIRSGFETLIIPAFERSCQTMFDQVSTVFQTEMIEHSSHVQRELASSHTALATNLQDLIAGASSLAKDLNDELVQSMTKLLRLVKTAGAAGEVNQHKDNLPDKVHSLRRVEESLDPTIELSRMLRAGMLEEAFNKALTAGDLQIVFWLCQQLDPVKLLSADPPPVSQGVLLSLVQQLSSDLSKDTGHKLRWIKEATLALNPRDPVIGPHMHSFLDLAFQNCHHQMGVSKDPSEQVTLRLVIHVINSLLSSCK